MEAMEAAAISHSLVQGNKCEEKRIRYEEEEIEKRNSFLGVWETTPIKEKAIGYSNPDD